MSDPYLAMFMSMFGSDLGGLVKDPLGNMDKDAIVIEYLAILNKSSNLSRSKRDAIVRVVNKWEELGELEWDGSNWRFI